MKQIWNIICPNCKTFLGSLDTFENVSECPGCQAQYRYLDGIWQFLTPARFSYFEPFLRDYICVRRAEGRGSDAPRYYRDLPQVPETDPLAWQWRIRSQTFRVFIDKILAELGGNLRILDLGAGVGWLSYHLARLGHFPCAVDINVDEYDGLRAARHYQPTWPLIQAEFDCLPFEDRAADIVVYNGSLHYSTNYQNTLREALRVLTPEGKIVVLDSPVYRRRESGLKMVAERKSVFRKKFGTPSGALANMEFLTWEMLRDFEKDVGIRFRIVRVWYGIKWALRPVIAAIKRKREPSTFVILVGSRILA